jgi:hypothetical protein
LAKISSRFVHSIEPDQRMYLSVLSCINVAGGCIPNFYIFKDTYFLEGTHEVIGATKDVTNLFFL